MSTEPGQVYVTAINGLTRTFNVIVRRDGGGFALTGTLRPEEAEALHRALGQVLEGLPSSSVLVRTSHAELSLFAAPDPVGTSDLEIS